MTSYESSIIIPVFNNWEFTKNCLVNLSSTIGNERVEIIVIDNASTDRTASECEPLGSSLFGMNFVYLRNSSNINFGPASNLGAKKSRGQYLVFLNNDTIPTKNWYRPLINDFKTFSGIAATGPLLSYGDNGFLGQSVQHLGIYLTPGYTVGHLHKGIPLKSSLARKRRFFQAITAACMVMPRNIFFEAGMFDERFINGFEDLDLCARLWESGYRMTINPDSLVIHHESKTPGRHAHEAENTALLTSNTLYKFVPDYQAHIKNDGLKPELNDWLTLHPALPEAESSRLSGFLQTDDISVFTDMLMARPYWLAGWEKLLKIAAPFHNRPKLLEDYFLLFPSGPAALAVCNFYHDHGNRYKFCAWLSAAFRFFRPFNQYVEDAEQMAKLCDAMDLVDMTSMCKSWLRNSKKFETGSLMPFLEQLANLAKQEKVRVEPANPQVLALWQKFQITS